MHVPVAGGSPLSDNALSACNVVGGRYRYITDLLALDQCRQIAHSAATTFSTSVNVAVWKKHLSFHPDPLFADWVIRGFEHGFRVGFNYGMHQCRPVRRNMRSAKEHEEIISSYLQEERARRRLIDPPPAL